MPDHAASPIDDFLTLAYRTDLATFTVRWLRAVSFAELQAGFGEALRLAQAHQAHRWLVDVRRRTELDAVSSTWVAKQLLVQAAAEAAPAHLSVAYLLSPSRAQELQHDSGLRDATTIAQADTQPYRLLTFLDEGPAVNWLLEQPR
ncbi:hypothetical protein GCM10027594_14890 [Hymenobacter agri]